MVVLERSDLMNVQKRVAILARVSTEDQAENTSLDTQVEICLKEAEKQGYKVLPEDIYREDGYSGNLSIADRPILSSLWEKYQAGIYDAIIVYRQDRLSRNLAHLIALRDNSLKVRRCGTKGKGFILVQGSFDDSPEGRLQSNILGSFAEYERESIRVRTLGGKKKLAQEGKYFGGHILYGFSWNRRKQRWEINEEEAKIVRLIYKWYVYGDNGSKPLGSTKIANRLTELGIMTPSQSKGIILGRNNKFPSHWSDATVQNILKNTAYAGKHYLWRESYNKQSGGKSNHDVIVSPETVEKAKSIFGDKSWFETDKFPAIVDMFLWEKAQEKRQNARGGLNRKNPKPLLSGRIKCGLCGHSFSTSFNKEQKVKFRCPGRSKTYHRDGSPKCTAPIIKGEYLTTAVKAELIKILNSPEQMKKSIMEYAYGIELKKTELDALLSPVTSKIDEIRDKKRKLSLILMNDGGLTTDEYETMLKDLNEQEIAMRKRYEEYLPEIDTLKKLEGNLNVLRDVIENEQFDVKYIIDENSITQEFAYVSYKNNGNPTVGFPNNNITWEELLDRLEINLVVYKNHIEVKGMLPVKDIAIPNLCYQIPTHFSYEN